MAPVAAKIAVAATSRAKGVRWLLFGFAVPFLPMLLIVAVVMPSAEQACSTITEDAELGAEYDGPGSLGGVAGTGVTAAELRAARNRGGAPTITAGDYVSTAYAPVAGGVNCDIAGACSHTASGIRVDAGRRRAYLIASNPKLLSYGSLVFVWPNPYKWRGPFVVADTGGAFTGAGRLDFYTFEPRSLPLAMSWGNHRTVKVSARQIVSGGPQVAPSPATAPAASETADKGRWPMPVPGTLSSNFGPRSSPGGIGSTNHEGVDFAVPVGTPIKVPRAGRVTFAGAMGGYGNYMCVLHQPQLQSCYAHISQFKARAGAAVTQGQVIALSGNTGNSTGPHLHFEIRRSSAPAQDPAVDPATFLSGQAPDSHALGAADAGCPVDTSDVAGSVSPDPAAKVGFPTQGGKGSIIGLPGQGTHSYSAPPHNWQSDRAIDLSIPVGTPLLAVEDGTICSGCGFGLMSADPGSRMAGQRFTMTGASGRQWYYAHLAKINVRPGQKVKRGDVIGLSGSAAGVPHLHLAVSTGDIVALLGLTKATTT